VKAPERLACDFGHFKGRSWGLPADIWALGCTILELITGSHFFQGVEDVPWREWTDAIVIGVVERRLENLEHELRAFLRAHARSDTTDAERAALEKVIRGMLRQTPQDRLTIHEVQTAWRKLV
jgi:serine/threonine protein kinase